MAQSIDRRQRRQSDSRREVSPPVATPGTDWSREEVEVCVADYLAMLVLERTGQAYSKSEHRRQLAKKLQGRSDGSIERKHQNISYVLLQLNCPPIDGYKPLSNYQKLLFDVVSDQIRQHPAVDAALSAAVIQPASIPSYPEFASMWTDAPLRSSSNSANAPDPDAARPWHARLIQRDYLQREALNRSLGEAGELLVMEMERWRLKHAGHHELSAKVLHVSREMGDGAGFDIRSYHADGDERFIEVKTTAFVRETPFFVSQREVEMSAREHSKYSIYRLFDFRRNPRLFELNGRIADHCNLDPQTFRASFS
jgi:hypothetical protein